MDNSITYNVLFIQSRQIPYKVVQMSIFISNLKIIILPPKHEKAIKEDYIKLLSVLNCSQYIIVGQITNNHSPFELTA